MKLCFYLLLQSHYMTYQDALRCFFLLQRSSLMWSPQCREPYQSRFLVPHTSLTLCSRAGSVNGRQETSVSDLPLHLGSCLVVARCAFYIHIKEFALPQHHKQTCVLAGSSPKHTKNICMTYETSAADLPKHRRDDGDLTSRSDLSLIIWPLFVQGEG